MFWLDSSWVILERIFRCCWVVCLGISKKISNEMGLLFGDLKGIGLDRCMNVVSGCLSFLIWLCGMVMLVFRFVDLSDLCVNRLLVMIVCVMLWLFLNSRLVCLNICFLLVMLMLRVMFLGGSSLVK